MKGLISIVIVIFFFVLPQAQIYVVGDTTGRYAYYPEYAFPDNSVSIHIDCDDSPDLVFNSNIVPENYNDWPRLSFHFYNNVQVLNSNSGYVTRFDYGDTIHLADDLWTPNLGHIYGLGEAGQYGVIQIDTEFIAFRLINPNDTVYIFLKISTSLAWMKIHQIISACNFNPLQETTASREIAEEQKVMVYPNPFSHQLTFVISDNEPATVFLYDLFGQKILQQSLTNSPAVNTEQLIEGI